VDLLGDSIEGIERLTVEDWVASCLVLRRILGVVLVVAFPRGARLPWP